MLDNTTPTQAGPDLRKVRILSNVSATDLDALAASVTWRRVDAGDTVVSHLDGGTQVFFVIDGAFNATLQTALGRKVAIRQLTAGAHFGEIAALMNTPRSLNIVAETDGLLAECPAEAFMALMARDSRFATDVAAHLARNLVALTDRVFELATLEVRFRVYAELLRLAAAGEPDQEGVLIRDAPTHEAIAEAIGTHREAVNRELRALESEGVIRKCKRELRILDIAHLRNELRRRAGATISETVDWRL